MSKPSGQYFTRCNSLRQLFGLRFRLSKVCECWYGNYANDCGGK